MATKATVISAVILATALPYAGISAASAATLPQTTPAVKVTTTVKGAKVSAQAVRLNSNVLKVVYSSNARKLEVRHLIYGRGWVLNTVTTNAQGRLTVNYPATTTAVKVRALGSPTLTAGGWVTVQVPPRRTTPKVTPVTPQGTVYDTCEKVDEYMKNGASTYPANMTIDYANACQRPNLQEDAPITLETPTVEACSVVPLDDAPNGWTTAQIKSAYGVDKKGWLVTLVYPMNGQQKHFDTNEYLFAYSTGGSNDSWGKLIHTGTNEWVNATAYVPGNLGDVITFTSQVANSKANTVNGSWKWVQDANGKVVPEWRANVAYSAENITLSPTAKNWQSNVRVTKFIPAGSSNADFNSRINVQVKNNATAQHQADYLPATTLNADTLGYDPERLVEHWFDPSRRGEPGYAYTPIKHASGSGAENAYQVPQATLNNACK